MRKLSLLVIVGFVGGLIWLLWYPTKVAARQSYLLAVRSLNPRLMEFAVVSVGYAYENFGIVIERWEQLIESPFFPFEPPIHSCGEGQFVLTFRPTGQVVQWNIKWIGKEVSEKHFYILRSRRLSENERTRLLLRALVQSPAWWYTQIEGLYKRFEAEGLRTPEFVSRYWNQKCPDTLRIKDLVKLRRQTVALQHLPRRNYLSAHREFLSRSLGIAFLDAWGHPIRLEWREGFLVASSAGADGRWGTADDLIAKRKAELPQP